MTIGSGVILGLIEGLTEFLPVSSTGHLILVRDLLGLPLQGTLGVDAVLNLAAIGAIAVYFFSDFLQIAAGSLRLQRKELTMLSALILGTIPGVIGGIYLLDYIDTTFRSPLLVAGALIVGSFVFIAAEKWGPRAREEGVEQDGLPHITVAKGLGVGIFQALALIPGMSRSGMSISGGLLLGLTRVEATRFAFLLSFPIIFGAGSVEFYKLYKTGALFLDIAPITVAAITAFGSALLAIHFMLKFVKTHSLMPFVWYRFGLAAVILISVALF